MEFFCVLSVGGSLASYHVQQENAESYKAVLRNNQGNREDIPAEVRLTKNNAQWHAMPWHDDIVHSLINAIENNGRQNSG